MSEVDYKKLDKEFIANTYGRFDVCFVKGEGSHLYDDKGKEYIDLGSGIAVASFGFGDELWKKAVIEQVNTLNHVSNLYYTVPQMKLAEKLCAKTGMKKIFFSNSGAESNECMIKAARKYSNDKYGEETGRNVIITMENSFHGRTIATLSATGQDVFHHHFSPFNLEGFIHIPANDLDAFYTAASENKVCAVMVETVQGEGGVMPLTQEFMTGIAEYAKEHDILLCVDEVQTGNGRTGKLYGYMNFGVQPDIFSTAKGLAGGLPFGATFFNEKTQFVLDAGSHGTTFGGNPICAAGAISIINRIDDAFMKDVVDKGEYIRRELSGAKGVKSVSGLGLMIGIETEKPAKEVVVEGLKRGIVALTAKDKVRLLPALNIPQEDLVKAIGILKEVITAK